MATWATLEINPTYMKQGNTDALINEDDNVMTDDQLKALNKDVSKNQMKQDLRKQLNLINNTTDNEYIDDIVDKYEEELQLALMYLQLYYFYFLNNDGEGTKNYDRMKQYEKLYNSEKGNFNNFTLDDKSFNSATIVNTIRV